ncbi:hypothetical protein MAR_004103, partial [Mya arenaria]
VLHSQRLREKPLQPWVIAKPDGVFVAAHCNCMAGLGEACTHVAALLFYVMAVVEENTKHACFLKASYSDFISFYEKAQQLQKKPGLLSVIDPFADEFISRADKLDLPEQLTKLRDPDLIG